VTVPATEGGAQKNTHPATPPVYGSGRER